MCIRDSIPPVFDAATRIMKVRLEAANAATSLWPGMFVDVEFPIALPPALTVPMDAVIDSGVQKTVFVAKGNGYFEPRTVKTGWRFGDRVEISEGLEVGEQIVIAGNFLLDSESRMRLAAVGVQSGAKDPSCGMAVDRLKAKTEGRTSQFQGQTYYFCSEQCKKNFANNPEKHLRKHST